MAMAVMPTNAPARDQTIVVTVMLTAETDSGVHLISEEPADELAEVAGEGCTTQVPSVVTI